MTSDHPLKATCQEKNILPFPQRGFQLALGMRYGRPSITDAMEELRAANVDRILFLPLYPQYSSSTTASTFDAVAQSVQKWWWVPEFRFINNYHDDRGYIKALVASIHESWEKNG